MEKVTSLAIGSTRQYWSARVRLDSVGLKFQVKTTKLNRDYGATFYATLDSSLFSDLIRQAIKEKMKHSSNVPSLYHKSKETYVLCQFRLPHGANKIHVQVSTGEQYNRPYGIAFGLYQIGLHASLKAHIKNLGLEGDGQGYKTSMVIDKIQQSKGMVWSVSKQKWVKMDENTLAKTPTQHDWDTGNVTWNGKTGLWEKLVDWC
jgi:hypothetical protein